MFIKNLKYELLKLLRNRMIIIVYVVLLTADIARRRTMTDSPRDIKMV